MVELRLLSMVDFGVKNVLEKFLTKVEYDYYSNDEDIKSKIDTLKKTITIEKEYIRKKTLAYLMDSSESEKEKEEKYKKNYSINHRNNNNRLDNSNNKI